MRAGPLMFLAFILAASNTGSRATNYYVASNGNDSNNGLSASAPFQSLAKVNSLNLLPRDQVLTRCCSEAVTRSEAS